MAKHPKSPDAEEIEDDAMEDISGGGNLQTRGEKLEANKEGVARMKAELYVESDWKDVIRKVDGSD